MTLQKQQYSTSFAFFENIWHGPSRLWIFDDSWKLHKLPSKVDKNEINKCCWTWIFRHIAEIVKAKQIYGYQRHSTGPFHQRKQKKWMLLNICLPPQTQKAIRLAICVNLGQRVVPFLAPFCNLHFLYILIGVDVRIMVGVICDNQTSSLWQCDTQLFLSSFLAKIRNSN